VICATNRDLHEMITKGTFREDLYYRINLITIRVPPLRERKGDIPLLVNHFLLNLGRLYHTPGIRVHSSTMKWLQNKLFPGNIRELKNLVERTWLLTGKDELEIPDFEKSLEQSVDTINPKLLPDPGTMTLEEIERQMIIKTFTQYKGNISRIAKSLGLSRATLYRRLEKYGIDGQAEGG